MTIKFLREHTATIPKDTPLRQKFDSALAEIEALEKKVAEKTEIEKKTNSRTTNKTAA